MNEIKRSQKFGYLKVGEHYEFGLLHRNGTGIRVVGRIENNVDNPKGVVEGIVKILNSQKDYILPIDSKFKY